MTNERLVYNLTEVLADALNTEQENLEPSLQEVVDLDALSQLIDNSETPTSISFEYQGYVVTVERDTNSTFEAPDGNTVEHNEERIRIEEGHITVDAADTPEEMNV